MDQCGAEEAVGGDKTKGSLKALCFAQLYILRTGSLESPTDLNRRMNAPNEYVKDVTNGQVTNSSPRHSAPHKNFERQNT
jgi:hypothetical protein